jgi:hypothetical protein
MEQAYFEVAYHQASKPCYKVQSFSTVPSLGRIVSQVTPEGIFISHLYQPF